jgi:hypothetical protein
MTLSNFDTQTMKIHFNFFHISVDFKLKKGLTASLVQKPYFVALSGRASPTSDGLMGDYQSPLGMRSYQPESYDFGELCSNHAHFPQ